MRKRRRLANKLTIMVCAVLIAVSTFFYAPMDVEASSNDVSAIVNQVVFPTLYNTGGISFPIRNFNFVSDLDSDIFYSVSMDIDFGFSFNDSVQLRDVNVFYGDLNLFYKQTVGGLNNASKIFNDSVSVSFVCKGSQLHSNDLHIYGRMLVNPNLGLSSESLRFDFSFSNLVCTPLTGEDSASYQQGYNAGYSAGEEVGESNGYSSGYSDGYEAGEQSGYNSGFEAGKESVDTQSYYDAGYQAGYDAGYTTGYDIGYDTGYDVGWSAYEAQMDKWGADTSDYPVLKYSFFEDELRLICDVFTSAPSTSYDSALLCYLDFDVNPNHTYKFVVRTGGTTGGTYDALYSDYKLNFVIGSNVINATNNVGQSFDFFIPGYNMGSSILFEAYVYDCVYSGGASEEDGFLKYSGQVYPTLKNCYIDVYDMGPSGDTQNHIANQTDQLTNGYDDSKGNTVNSELSTGLNEYETAENSLFATATTGMKDFTFFDFESVPAMLTAVTFITSIMGSWFEQAGGASGVGIVLSILFSVMLVSMVLGLYRLYQSAGHRAEARERHRERMEQWKRGK